jgi:hypothetical protein
MGKRRLKREHGGSLLAAVERGRGAEESSVGERGSPRWLVATGRWRRDGGAFPGDLGERIVGEISVGLARLHAIEQDPTRQPLPRIRDASSLNGPGCPITGRFDLGGGARKSAFRLPDILQKSLNHVKGNSALFYTIDCYIII